MNWNLGKTLNRTHGLRQKVFFSSSECVFLKIDTDIAHCETELDPGAGFLRSDELGKLDFK